jgi:hypothetical protein|tara:strand:- start:905 stop:1021 length:117 start_codon:yes stop_codon:yes gene_type:complete
MYYQMNLQIIQNLLMLEEIEKNSEPIIDPLEYNSLPPA